MEKIFRELLVAYKPEQIREIFQEIGADKMRFEPVGGRPNNIATINIGSDPAAGVTERITNAIDAVLEKEWLLRNQPIDIRTPRKATEEWYGIETGNLATIQDPHDARLTNLSSLITVSLHDSGNDAKPTVEIRDKGIGLKSEDFSKTILSLNESNKIGKLHLMGAYGQGGSTALSYNSLTVIISKLFSPQKGGRKCVAWTIVRINQGDINVNKHPWYEYMVEAATGQPFVSEISDDDFEPGTLVRHILMDLGKYKGKITTPTNSLWYLAHNYLFDPVIPFTITDKRNDKNEKRTVTGNNRLLTYTDNLQYYQSVPLTFKDGKVVIYYWVLNTTGENPRDRIKHYAQPSNPILITFNGQKQGTLGNGIIKNELKLPFLDRYLIVQIEADNLDSEARRQLFSSTRESLRDTSILEELRKLTIDTLSEDDKLKVLDRERKQRYFKQEDTQVLDNLRRRLAKRINVFLQSSGSGQTVTATKVSDTANTEKMPEIPIEDPPTFFEITTKSPREVFPNKTFSIKFRTDAHPNYFSRADTFVAFIEPQSFGMFTGTARVVDGYGLAYFKVGEETEVGEEGSMTLELRPPRQKSFNGSVDAIAIAEPDNADTGGDGNNKTPNIVVDFLYRNDAFYIEQDWNEESVAAVLDDQDGILIYVSAENKNLTKLVARAQRHSEEAVANIKNKYLEHVAFHAFILDKAKSPQSTDDEPIQISDEIIEQLRDRELRHASETICGILNDFFESIIIGSPEEDAIAA